MLTSEPRGRVNFEGKTCGHRGAFVARWQGCEREPDGFCLLWEVREDISVKKEMLDLES